MLNFKKFKETRFLMVLPCIIFILFITIYPLVYNIIISFFRWTLTSPPKFIGVENYIFMIGDLRFLNSIKLTLMFTVACLTLEFVVGLGLALLFEKDFIGKKVSISMILIPMMMAPVVVGFTARMLFNMKYGAVNQILSFITQRPIQINWLSDPTYAIVTIIVSDFWQWTPFIFISILAGLTSIPRAPLESASIDGASRWQIIRYVKLPLIKTILLIVILLRMLEILKIFDVIKLATKGGPGVATESLSAYIYDITLRYFTLGKAAASSFLFLFIVVILTTFLIRIIRTE